MTRRLSTSVLLALALCLLALWAMAAPPAPAAKSPHGKSITKGLDCAACHTTTGWDLLGGTPTAGAGFDHARTGFPLTGRHRRVACTNCHTGERAVRRDCAGCHQDAHERRLGQACDSCHSAAGWRTVRAIEQHRSTRLPLTGMHALLDCTQCHRRTTERQWSGVPADCFACHAKDYWRTDIHPVHSGTPTQAPFPRDCAQCHRPSGWSPAVISSSKSFGLAQGLASAKSHDARFPISHGKHRGAGCPSCHQSLERPRIVRCDGCHAHSPLLLRRQHRRVPGAIGSCLGCHPGGARR